MTELNNDIITNMRISLENAHVQGIPDYIKRLQYNSNNEDVFQDLRLEGTASLIFAQANCKVTIRESPDLALKFNNKQLYAEVKHFRKKEQDKIDDAKMSGLDDESELEPYGNTFPLEGKHAWEEIYDVAKKKLHQYKENAPNILVIESHSSSIDDSIMSTAINIIDEDVRSGKCPEFDKLNGMLLTTLGLYNISQKRQGHFRRTSNPAVSLSRELSGLLDEIRQG